MYVNKCVFECVFVFVHVQVHAYIQRQRRGSGLHWVDGIIPMEIRENQFSLSYCCTPAILISVGDKIFLG